MSKIEEIAEPNLQLVLSHQIREQENQMQDVINIPFVLTELIGLYIQCISRRIDKHCTSNNFEIKIIQPTTWKSQQYEYIEYEFTHLNFAKKLSIGVYQQISNKIKNYRITNRFGVYL